MLKCPMGAWSIRPEGVNTELSYGGLKFMSSVGGVRLLNHSVAEDVQTDNLATSSALPLTLT